MRLGGFWGCGGAVRFGGCDFVGFVGCDFGDFSVLRQFRDG